MSKIDERNLALERTLDNQKIQPECSDIRFTFDIEEELDRFVRELLRNQGFGLMNDRDLKDYLDPVGNSRRTVSSAQLLQSKLILNPAEARELEKIKPPIFGIRTIIAMAVQCVLLGLTAHFFPNSVKAILEEGTSHHPFPDIMLITQVYLICGTPLISLWNGLSLRYAMRKAPQEENSLNL